MFVCTANVFVNDIAHDFSNAIGLCLSTILRTVVAKRRSKMNSQSVQMLDSWLMPGRGHKHATLPPASNHSRHLKQRVVLKTNMYMKGSCQPAAHKTVAVCGSISCHGTFLSDASSHTINRSAMSQTNRCFLNSCSCKNVS